MKRSASRVRRFPKRPRHPRALWRVENASVVVALLLLLLLVQLPLVWMILTAFKARGTAFQLRFLPETSLHVPARHLSPLPLPILDEGGRYVHAELQNPGATTVDLVIHAIDREALMFPMQYLGGGTWSATVGPIPYPEVQHHFLVDGTRTVEAPETPAAGGAVELHGGINILGEAADWLVYRSGNTIHAQVRGTAGHSFALQLNEERVEPLRRQGAQAEASDTALFGLTVPSRGERTFRIVERRGLGEAIADRYTLGNFRLILMSQDFDFGRYFFNSLVVAGSSGALTVFLCLSGAFAFGYFRFHFREALFALLLTSMLVPGMIYMVPQFSITIKLGLMNTYAGMVVPHLANVFGLFLLRQYVLQIPPDLLAAAEIDGAGDLQVFRSIVIPMCLPIMVTLFLVVFVSQWSNFLWQLIVNTGDSQVLTLPVGLQQFKGQNATEWERIMAGACFSILPITILFLTLQKYFLRGLTAGAVKE